MDEKSTNNLIVQSQVEAQYTVSPVPYHTHNGTDSPLITTVDLPPGTEVSLGLGAAISFSNSSASGSTAEQINTALVSGKDPGTGVGISSKNLQFNLLHQPQNASNQSFINAFRPPLYSIIPGTTITVTASGNTLTTSGYGFGTNVLANALINIFNSSGTLVETQTIASNTATVITISGTWLHTTTGGTFFIFQPVFFGSADTPFQRLYTQEGIGAGIRFGVGPTNGGQNGLEYMDAAGDLYWRDKAGTSTKLNTGAGGGTVTSFAFPGANGFSGVVTNPTTTPSLDISVNATGVLYHPAGNPVVAATIPSDDTQFLNGATAPAYAKVKDSDLSTSNVTTNNVTSAKHGFVPLFPNNTTTFFRGDGTYATLPGGNASYANNTTTYNLTTASGNQTIAHGLSSTPAYIEITATIDTQVASSIWSEGTYNGTTMSCIYLANGDNNHNNTFGGKTNSFIIVLEPNTASGGDNQSATVTVDATNITLAWTKFGSPIGTAQIMWKANT